MTAQTRLTIHKHGNFPASDEYGATLEQATAAQDAALAEIKAERKTGKLKAFTGKL